MSSATVNDAICRSAARLRLAVFAVIVVMILLYGAARLGLQVGHARIEYGTHGPDISIVRLAGDVSIALLLVALYRLTEMLRLIAGGDLFGVEVIRRFRSFAWWLLLMALFELAGPFLFQLASVATGTLHQIHLTIDSRDVLTVGVTLLLFLLARLLERARGIEEEMREIV